MTAEVINAECVATMIEMASRGVQLDSCVTDPPYHLTSIVDRFGGKNAKPAKHGKDGAFARASRGFMSATWDGGDVAFQPETWRAVYNILKPGSHLCAFGGTRTFHRMVCAIEDAEFEIRDTLGWMYGSGFPKSHDVSKGIDKAAGAEREVVDAAKAAQQTASAASVPYGGKGNTGEITAPATPEAKQWQGWGTALKPSFEPICLARKPLSEKTVAANVLTHGTGAINIDGCRIGTDGGTTRAEQTAHPKNADGTEDRSQHWARTGHSIDTLDAGRWPANLCHDGSDEVTRLFPDGGPSTSAPRHNGDFQSVAKNQEHAHTTFGHDDLGGNASRFFYCAKADKEDRAGSKHPTVKPRALMRWLVRLITPPGGTVLDCFAGTGSTLQAALAEGFHAIGIEREAEYAADIKRRLQRVSGEDSPLFQTTQALQIDLEDLLRNAP